MSWASRRGAVALGLLGMLWGALGTAGCAKEQAQEAAAHDHQATTLGLETCSACGMVVREQPAPRGQAVHRDGTRQFFCSLADMVQYAEVPSPHGALTHSYVEVLEPGADPLQSDVEPHAWVEADSATFVLGVERQRIMGLPVLAYAQAEAARAVAQRHGATVHSWAEVRRRVMESVHNISDRR